MTETFDSLNKSVSLKELVFDKKLPDIVAPVFPGQGCGFFAVSFIAPLITRSAAVMIAPAICAHNARIFMSRFEQSSFMIENNLVFFLYEENDIIHGAEETIKNSLIEYCTKQNHDVVFVVTSCLPEIVGEDIEAVVRQVNDTVSMPVLCIRTENFTNISSKQGIERAFEALADLMEYPEQKVPKSVNIIGTSAFRSAGTELINVLKNADISFYTIIPSHTDVDSLKKAPSAAYNIILDRGALPLAEKMKEKFNLDYFLFDRPFSPETILSLYKNLGTFLSVDLESYIYPQYQNLLQIISSLRPHLLGKKVIISTGHGRAFDLGFLLQSLGLEIMVIATGDLYEDDYTDAHNLYSLGGRPEIIRNVTCYPLEEFLLQKKPDYYLTFSGYEEKFCQENQIKYRNNHMFAFLNGFDLSIQMLSEIFSEFFEEDPNFSNSASFRGISS